MPVLICDRKFLFFFILAGWGFSVPGWSETTHCSRTPGTSTRMALSSSQKVLLTRRALFSWKLHLSKIHNSRWKSNCNTGKQVLVWWLCQRYLICTVCSLVCLSVQRHENCKRLLYYLDYKTETEVYFGVLKKRICISVGRFAIVWELTLAAPVTIFTRIVNTLFSRQFWKVCSLRGGIYCLKEISTRGRGQEKGEAPSYKRKLALHAQ